jgi:hypothetical protein
MSLIYCPECGHDVSTNAIACPNCGRPLVIEPPTPKLVVANPPVRERGFPTWAFIPLGILGVLILFIVFFAISRNNDEAADRVNVNVAGKRPSSSTTDSREVTRSDPQTVTIPPSSTSVDSQTVTVPPSSQTSIPASSAPPPPPTKGSAVISAKITTRSGSTQPVRSVKFYLLDNDLESILSDARLDPVDGQTLSNSLGLSMMYPDRYGDFYRKALGAIKNHIKYATTTDAGGKGEIKNIEPDSYYLFGVTKTSEGFAVWSSPVSITDGQNMLNLSPQALTGVSD